MDEGSGSGEGLPHPHLPRRARGAPGQLARRAAYELWADVEPNIGHRSSCISSSEASSTRSSPRTSTSSISAFYSDPRRIVEIHGTTRKAACLSCAWRADIEVVLDRVRGGEADPPCPVCGDILKSATVSFGQSLDPGDLRRAEVAATEADLFLAIGTSLAVFPVNETVTIAKRAGAAIVIVNAEPTPFDRIADVVLHEKIAEVVPSIVGMPDA
ncbi:MAG: Sir2 family NAD-dependent protein deacetylase [Acidimicrobiales bacterium]